MRMEANPFEGPGPGLKHAIIIGMNSDIAKEIKLRLERDDWTVNGTTRSDHRIPNDRWDLCLVAQGTMNPIGKFFDCDHLEWERCVQVNAFNPLWLLRCIWGNRKVGAKIVFMSGPNPNVPTPTYTAYRAGKALLESLVTTLNEESYPTEVRFYWFIPGVVKTKLHFQTLAAGDRAANLQRARDIVEGRHPVHSFDDVYSRLMAQIGEVQFPENEGV